MMFARFTLLLTLCAASWLDVTEHDVPRYDERKVTDQDLKIVIKRKAINEVVKLIPKWLERNPQLIANIANAFMPATIIYLDSGRTVLIKSVNQAQLNGALHLALGDGVIHLTLTQLHVAATLGFENIPMFKEENITLIIHRLEADIGIQFSETRHGIELIAMKDSIQCDAKLQVRTLLSKIIQAIAPSISAMLSYGLAYFLPIITPTLFGSIISTILSIADENLLNADFPIDLDLSRSLLINHGSAKINEQEIILELTAEMKHGGPSWQSDEEYERWFLSPRPVRWALDGDDSRRDENFLGRAFTSYEDEREQLGAMVYSAWEEVEPIDSHAADINWVQNETHFVVPPAKPSLFSKLKKWFTSRFQ